MSSLLKRQASTLPIFLIAIFLQALLYQPKNQKGRKVKTNLERFHKPAQQDLCWLDSTRFVAGQIFQE